jgi:hypothetical protein
MTMTPEEVGRTVCREYDAFRENAPTPAGWDELRQHLAAWLATVEESLAFAGLLWVIENSQPRHHLLAGELLLARNIPLLIPPKEFISRIAPRFDASASSVIRYLKSQIGRAEALRQVHDLRDTATYPAMRVGLDACRYHLGEHPCAG